MNKMFSVLFFCLFFINYMHNLAAMIESKKTEAPLTKRVTAAMAAMNHALDRVTMRASQAREDKEIVMLHVETLVNDVMNSPECVKKLNRLPGEIRYNFLRGLALAWAKIPDSFTTAEDCVRALRNLRKKLRGHLLHELEYGRGYNKKMLHTAESLYGDEHKNVDLMDTGLDD